MRYGLASEARGYTPVHLLAGKPSLKEGLLYDGSGCLLRITRVWQYFESQGTIFVDNGRFGRHDSQVTATIKHFSFLSVLGWATIRSSNPGGFLVIFSD